MRLKLKHTTLALAGLLVSLVTGCHNADHAAATAFDNAPPEIKQTWEKSTNADRANDYVTAVLGYRSLLKRPGELQTAQLQAVEAASGKLFQRLVDASTQGNAEARRALNTLGAMDRGRPLL